MSEETDWNFDEHHHMYIRLIGTCKVKVWQHPDGQWITTIESGRRQATRAGFLSFFEAHAWIEQQISEVATADRRRALRAS